ncbi:arylsulfatase [Lentisphaera araneosa HTCC2155]|uniref:Arylsulfatase n=2 Tax=Lentisphaera TaxID=256846 RepID=A6DJ46_9BACT|nr:arylsulfatase [Lentisphaera araneosa HTCC2155]
MKFLSLKLWALIGICLSAPLAFSAEKPNVIFILVDDMGYSDLGCYGSEIKTPNLDKLAANGIRYTATHNTSKCYTSRACLLSGMYYQRLDREMTKVANLGEVIRPTGYRTLWSGKNHNGGKPWERGFDRFYGLMGGASNHFNPGGKARPGEPEPAGSGGKWIIDDKEVKGYVPEDKNWYSTDAMTDAALGWLKEYESEEKPFFLYLAYTAPHYPLHAKAEDMAKYEGVYDVGYDVIRNARYKRQLEMGMFDEATTPLSAVDQKKPWAELSEQEKKDEILRMQIYAGMIDCIDQNIGRVTSYLESVGKLDNTLIMFASDNGACASTDKPAKNQTGPIGSINSYECTDLSWANVSNTPFRFYKLNSHEGGILTPMIASWPKGIDQKNVFNRENIHFIDIMPTLMDLAGATYPGEAKNVALKKPDGVSLVPSFTGEKINRNVPIFYEYGSGKAVQEGNMKLVGVKEWELYDLSKDRSETKNLINEQPEVAKSLADKWNSWYTGITGLNYEEEKERKKKAKKAGSKEKAEKKKKLRKSAAL